MIPKEVLTTILHCTTCGREVEDEDFAGNVARMRRVPLWQPVEPVKCAAHRTSPQVSFKRGQS